MDIKKKILQLKLRDVEEQIKKLKKEKSNMSYGAYRKRYIALYNLKNYYMKKISNKWFECEICHNMTPIECEGKEPNVCADCYGEKQW